MSKVQHKPEAYAVMKARERPPHLRYHTVEYLTTAEMFSFVPICSSIRNSVPLKHPIACAHIGVACPFFGHL
jgi:hypothetical protein